MRYAISTPVGNLKNKDQIVSLVIEHFTVVCSVTWPLNGSEARGDLVFIQTSLILLCKSSCSYEQREKRSEIAPKKGQE